MNLGTIEKEPKWFWPDGKIYPGGTIRDARKFNLYPNITQFIPRPKSAEDISHYTEEKEMRLKPYFNWNSSTKYLVPTVNNEWGYAGIIDVFCFDRNIYNVEYQWLELNQEPIYYWEYTAKLSALSNFNFNRICGTLVINTNQFDELKQPGQHLKIWTFDELDSAATIFCQELDQWRVDNKLELNSVHG